MNSRSQIHINLTGLAFLSFVFGVVYMVGHTREMLNIITSYVQYNQRSYLNLSNLAYCLVGVAHVLLSVGVMYPHKSMMVKKDMLKITCYLMTGIYLLANVWIFQWFFQNLVSGNWSFDVAQFLKVENMMFNHMQWVSRNAEVIFYNHIAAVCWFLMGYYIDRDRKTTCKLMLAQMVITFIVPLVVYYLLYGKVAPDWWMKKTIPLFCSDVILAFGLIYVARSREAWIKYISPLRKSKRKHRHHHHHHSSENSANVEDVNSEVKQVEAVASGADSTAAEDVQSEQIVTNE